MIEGGQKDYFGEIRLSFFKGGISPCFERAF